VSLNEHARDGWPFYLVVLGGQFVPSRYPNMPPRPICTLLWSPRKERREVGIRNDLPAAISRLGTAHTISLD
jgi:hypothetical protein